VRWIAKFLVLYAVAVVLVGVVAVTMTSTTGAGQPVHSQMDPVSHNDYELHKSIGHIP
jgi:hypothetical protein